MRHPPPPTSHAVAPDRGSWRLSLVADFVLPFAGRDTGLEFGGLSGLAFDPDHGVWIGVSDDRRSPRWFTMRVGVGPGGLRVDVGPAVLAENAAVPPVLDFESVGVLPNGDLMIGSEGDLIDGVHHRHAIVRFTRDGRFVGEVPLPDHYRGDPAGATPRGLRGNLGFEGLALSPDGRRAWLAAENPLAQDDDQPTIEAGARTRLLELVARGDTFVPGRELVYEIAPAGRPATLGPGAVLGDQGVVELLWLADHELLSMERAFLRDRPDARAVEKTLVLDDNFSARQQNAFVLLALRP